jgi:hypothetical protein
MAVTQSPDQQEELEHVDEILLRELQRVDEILLQELERVDEVLLRIVTAIDRLPERIAEANGSEHLGSVSGNGRRAAGSARSRASTRPFDPYEEDEVEVAEDKKSAAGQLTSKVQGWVVAYAPDREALSIATPSLAVASLATAIAVVGLIVAVFH